MAWDTGPGKIRADPAGLGSPCVLSFNHPWGNFLLATVPG